MEALGGLGPGRGDVDDRTVGGDLGLRAAGAANSTSCPLAALKKASKPVQIVMWHSMNRALGDTLTKLTDAFNASQTDVKVSLVNQVDYPTTLSKYKAGLASGDLPDIVQLQETDQQQMIDTQTVLPASVCAKADKYSFSDFLPRVISYFTVQGKQYAMPFNTSGPVLYYNKKAFTAAGLDPNSPPKTLDDVRADAEKLKANGVSAPLGLKTEPGYFEHWRALANRLFVDQSNGRKARATKTVFDDPTGRQIFTWMSGMVKDGLATTNPDLGTGNFDNLLGIQRLARDGVRDQRRARHHQRGAERRAGPERRAGGGAVSVTVGDRQRWRAREWR